MDATADAPSRATNNIRLQFMLIGVPIQLFTATEDTKPVDRHTYKRDTLQPIGQLKVIRGTTTVVTNDDCAYMVDVDDKLVELTDDEMLAATAGTAVDKGDVEVIAFVPVSSVGDKYVVDSSRLYQARPTPREVGKKKVPDAQANKLFALLLAALAKDDVAALFRVGLRGTARHAVLMADGMVRFLFYADEIRLPLPIPEVEVTDAELAQFSALIEAIGTETPDLVNHAKEAIRECLVAKAAGMEAAPVVAVEPQAEILDYTAALAASVAAAKAKKKAA